MKQTKEYKETKPIIKGCIALVLHIRHPMWEIHTCFVQAGQWLEELERDME